MTYLVHEFAKSTALAAPAELSMAEGSEGTGHLVSGRGAVHVTSERNMFVREVRRSKSVDEALFEATAAAKRWILSATRSIA